MIRGFEQVKDEFRRTKGEIKLPTQGSKNSAGYDFYSPVTIIIPSHKTVNIPTDIKAYMQEDEVLMIFIRSSVGIKDGLMLANNTGIIDSDFYSNPSNDGGISMCLYNYSDKDVLIRKGERIAQGIFMKYLLSDNGNSTENRTGGIGSTNK